MFIEVPQHVPLLQRAALKLALEQALSLPIDVIVSETSKPSSTFQAVAKARSIALEPALR